jgi:hypothetical protein
MIHLARGRAVFRKTGRSPGHVGRGSHIPYANRLAMKNLKKHLLSVILPFALLFAMTSTVALGRDHAVTALHADRQTATDCPASGNPARFTIPSQTENGISVQPTPRGNLEMSASSDYCYTDGGNHGCGTYEFQDNKFTFTGGPLQIWNYGYRGQEGRSIRFNFENDSHVPVEIVMQESCGCDPWPECNKE